MRPAFRELGFHKIYTYAFDLRPRLYTALEKAGFKEEARLKEHCKVDGYYTDVLIHTMINPLHDLDMRLVKPDDIEVLFHWVNDPTVRANAINTDPISWKGHYVWFNERLASPNTKIYIVSSSQNPVGQLRIDRQDSFWLIDYSVDIKYRGLGLGWEMLTQLLAKNPKECFKAQVRKDNIASQRVFERLSFQKTEVKIGELDMFEYTLNYA